MNDKLKVPMYETDAIYKQIAEGSLSSIQFFEIVNDLVERVARETEKKVNKS